MNKLKQSTPKVVLDDLVDCEDNIDIEKFIKECKVGRKKKSPSEVTKVTISKKVVIDYTDLNDEIVKDLRKVIREYTNSKKQLKDNEQELVIDGNEISYKPPNLVVSFN